MGAEVCVMRPRVGGNLRLCCMCREKKMDVAAKRALSPAHPQVFCFGFHQRGCQNQALHGIGAGRQTKAANESSCQGDLQQADGPECTEVYHTQITNFVWLGLASHTYRLRCSHDTPAMMQAHQQDWPAAHHLGYGRVTGGTNGHPR
jgi:hypothetical protein